MKTLLFLFVAVGLTLGIAAAQDITGNANNDIARTKAGVDVGGFQAPQTLGPTRNLKTNPNPNPVLKPKVGGIFVDGAKYGTQLINPAAPASYGYGAKYLTAPSSRSDLMHESGPAAHRDAGGFKLFSIEF